MNDRYVSSSVGFTSRCGIAEQLCHTVAELMSRSKSARSEPEVLMIFNDIFVLTAVLLLWERLRKGWFLV